MERDLPYSEHKWPHMRRGVNATHYALCALSGYANVWRASLLVDACVSFLFGEYTYYFIFSSARGQVNLIITNIAWISSAMFNRQAHMPPMWKDVFISIFSVRDIRNTKLRPRDATIPTLCFRFLNNYGSAPRKSNCEFHLAASRYIMSADMCRFFYAPRILDMEIPTAFRRLSHIIWKLIFCCDQAL